MDLLVHERNPSDVSSAFIDTRRWLLFGDLIHSDGCSRSFSRGPLRVIHFAKAVLAAGRAGRRINLFSVLYVLSCCESIWGTDGLHYLHVANQSVSFGVARLVVLRRLVFFLWRKAGVIVFATSKRQRGKFFKTSNHGRIIWGAATAGLR